MIRFVLALVRLPPGAVWGTFLPKPFIIDVSQAISLPKSASGFRQFKLWLLVVCRLAPDPLAVYGVCRLDVSVMKNGAPIVDIIDVLLCI